ncbi:hypothetical protein BJX62DRAFT_248351 [Aspergillus germanicus]
MSSARSLDIPHSSSTVEVSIIDTMFDARLPTGHFMAGKERSILSDLGTPKDLVNDFPPKVAERVKGMGTMHVEKYVSEILKENHVPLQCIEAIIWSSILEIGGLKALDYFGDGSFYLLSAPGHAIRHLNALARTTEKTFIYLAGYSIHHLSELRPHPASHLPQYVPLPGRGHCCSGASFHAIHPLTDISNVPNYYHEPLGYPSSTPDTAPFFTISQKPWVETLASNIEEARDTIKAVQRFDADENIFVVAAHDASTRGILDLFPNKANDWKLNGLKEKGRWLFLSDFEEALKVSGTEVGVGAGTA